MKNNNQYNIELLINYYQNTIDLNDIYADIGSNADNNRFKHIVTQLAAIRQALINKDLTNVDSLYEPIESLLISKEHRDTLEDNVEFYKRNPNSNYDVIAAEQYLSNHPTKLLRVDFSDKQQVLKYVEQNIAASLNITLAKLSEDLNAKLASNEAIEEVNKSTNDMLAFLTTSREEVKESIAKYNTLLIEHINKSGVNTANAVEMEHDRFVQKIASNSNALIAGFSEAAATELGKITELVQQKLKEYEDKSFIQYCVAFVVIVGALFGTSILSSTWAARKALDDAKVFKIVVASSPSKSLSSSKSKH